MSLIRSRLPITHLAKSESMSRQFVPLSETNPDLAVQADGWDPSTVSAGSQRVVAWRCSQGHQWTSKVQNRAKQGQGCPYCAGRRPSRENNLLAWCEANGEFGKLLLEQFDTELNDIQMSGLLPGTHRKVWWRCRGCGDGFEASPNRRTSMRTTCPVCSGHIVGRSSNLAYRRPDVAEQWDLVANYPLTPDQVTHRSNRRVWWKCDAAEDHRWEASVNSQTSSASRRCPFCSGHRASSTNSLISRAPEVAKEWHPKKNGGLTPADITSGSAKKVWWLCTKNEGHEWAMPVADRTSQGQGCPFCANRRVSGENNLRTVPSLVALFDKDRNETTPEEVYLKSSKLFWWKCPEGSDHRWKATPQTLSGAVQPCPFCPPRIRRLSLTNSVTGWCNANGDKGRRLLDEWDHEANGERSPESLIYMNQRTKVWWKCPEGSDHRWQAPPYKRTVDGADCPFCNLRRPSLTNNLAFVFPELVTALHPTLNGEFDPSLVSPTSHEKVWWQCPVGEDHVWQATPNQMKGQLRCGFCAGKRASITNSLASRFPEIAEEFDLALNAPLTPSEVTFGSKKKVWWRCSSDQMHSWHATVSSRTGVLKTGCPQCVIVPRSRREILISHELGEFFEIDQFDHRIRTSTRTYDCDIIARGEKLIFEYDGSFWHQDREDRDRRKTEELIDSGWAVVRIRERPLAALQTHDVVVTDYEPIPEVVAKILQAVAQIGQEFKPDWARYIEEGVLRRQDSAERFIQDLLRSPDLVTAYRQRQSWEKKFDQLTSIAELHGTADVPDIEGSSRKLRTWVHAQRRLYSEGRLSVDQVLRLEGLPGWHWSQIDFRWRRQYEEVLLKAETDGRIETGELNAAAKSWLIHQRVLHRRGQLVAEQTELLEGIPGWDWQPLDTAWEGAFNHLLEYVNQTGDALVPQDYIHEGFRLGTWVNKQRGRHRRKSLESDRIERLEALPGWSWAPTQSRTEEMFEALNQFAEREGHVNVPAPWVEEGVKLGQWLNGVRQRQKQGNLDPNIAARLSHLPGFSWTPLDDKLKENLSLILEFLNDSPSARIVRGVKYKGRNLGNIAQGFRNRFFEETLPAEIVATLESLTNWSWSTHDDQWQRGWESLLAYVSREGDALVRQDHHEEGFPLGRWVHGRRVAYRKGSLKPDRITALESLPGWTWTPKRGPRGSTPTVTPITTRVGPWVSSSD